jgi:hypothetical protein
VEPVIDRHALEQGDNRHRVGRRDQDAEESGADPAPAHQIMHPRRDDPRRQQHAHRDEQQQDRQLAAERAPRDLDRRLEHERRQENAEHQFRRERQVQPERQHAKMIPAVTSPTE